MRQVSFRPRGGDQGAGRRCLARGNARSHRADADGGLSRDLLARAFAIVREASRQTLGMRHHDVQLLAGQALLRGRIAEMATGEGKTLAATLGVCTAAMAVRRFMSWRSMVPWPSAVEDNTPLFAFFGLSVGVVKQDMSIDDRRSLYARDVVYVSNKELTFDYLKDPHRPRRDDCLATRLRRRAGDAGRPTASCAACMWPLSTRPTACSSTRQERR